MNVKHQAKRTMEYVKMNIFMLHPLSGKESMISSSIAVLKRKFCNLKAIFRRLCKEVKNNVDNEEF